MSSRPSIVLAPCACLFALACETGATIQIDKPSSTEDDPAIEDTADTASDTSTETATDTSADTSNGDTSDTGTGPAVTPRSCLDIERDAPRAPSGDYLIDPDGDGGNASFYVTCDLETDGGGWTRFWWYSEAGITYWRDWGITDTLGSELASCTTVQGLCFARIPDTRARELRIFEGTDWATWQFVEGNSTSERAWAAFVNHEPSPYELDVYGDAWNPVRQSDNSPTLTNPYRCDATPDYPSDGGCRQFWYTQWPGFYGPIYGFNLDDDGGWGHTAFSGGTSNVGSDLGVDALEQHPSYNDPYKVLEMYYR
jgi:hypothetical protein